MTNGNVMWMSDSFNAPSGFGQQTFHVVSRLTTGNNPIHIDNIAWQLFGNPILLNDYWRVLPTGGSFAQNIFPHHVKIYKPDLVITLADLWNVQYLVTARREHDFKWMEWLPIDGMPINQKMKWTSSYNEIDVIVAMSDFGYNQLMNGSKVWSEKFDRPIYCSLEKVYHGIATDLLVPYDEDRRMDLRKNYDWQENFYWNTKIRQEFITGKKDLRDYYIFGIVARNQPRKNYPELIQAWAEFAEEHENVLLWIHAVPADSAQRVGNLHFFVDQLGCADSVVFSDSVSNFYGKSSKEMGDVFNLFDCHFLPTAGEGFGIPTVEAMSCGVLPAVTDFTTGAELINNGECGYLIRNDRLEISPGAVMRAHILKEEIIEALEAVYNMNEVTRRHRVEKARKRAVEVYDAKYAAEGWRNLIDKYMARPATPRVEVPLDIQLHYDFNYMMSREVESHYEYSRNERRNAGQFFKEGETLLDVGAGSGEGIIAFTRHYGVRCIGLDVSEKSIEFCRRKGLNVKLHDANERLPYADGAFDIVWTQHVVEHLDNDVEAMLDCLRVSSRLAVHVLPHDNMIDKSHQRRYVLREFKPEDYVFTPGHVLEQMYKDKPIIFFEDLAKQVEDEWNSKNNQQVKSSIIRNYYGDKEVLENLCSCTIIFEKV
jgi:glycosyltransferase involved in cell wall biosynthesis/ubiquinone/menaquinone biosynthesis C-methylase UbiE